MASPSSIREVRAIVSSTFATVHANAATDSWALTNDSVHKLRVIAADVSGLEQPGIEDETLQTRFHAKPKMIEGLAKGSLKLTTYAGGAYANVQVGPEWNIAAAAAGGFQPPTTSRSIAAGAAVSVRAGVWLTHHLPVLTLRRGFAGLLILAGVYMLMR
jgi:hypothetical protein